MNSQPYKNCSSWQRRVKRSRATYLEQKKFEEHPIFTEMADRVRARLGLDREEFSDGIFDFLNFVVLILPFTGFTTLLFELCGFETAWFPDHPSPWCALLKREDLDILEYHEELEIYYKDGPGHHYNYLVACETTADFLRLFQ